MNKNQQKMKGLERNQAALKRLIHNRDNRIKEQAAELEGAMMWIIALVDKLGAGEEVRLPIKDIKDCRGRQPAARIEGEDLVIRP